MKTLTAALLASAFITAPAFACNYGKTAETPVTTALTDTVKPDEAMTTFDPATQPLFEEKTEVLEEAAPVEKKEIAE